MSMASIVLYAFLDKPGEYSVPDAERGVGAEFDAAEATDTAVIIEYQCPVFHSNGFGRACVPAYSAETAFILKRMGPGCKIPAQVVFQERGEPPLDIGRPGQAEPAGLRFVERNAGSPYA